LHNNLLLTLAFDVRAEDESEESISPLKYLFLVELRVIQFYGTSNITRRLQRTKGAMIRKPVGVPPLISDGSCCWTFFLPGTTILRKLLRPTANRVK
jgi:hypothetical protein